MKIRQPQTKRKTLKLKYTIIKKVSQHHRRLRKEARKAEKAGLVRKKTKKDPGIPNNWPFKHQELVALKKREERREKELADRKKQAHHKVQAERKEALKLAQEARAEKRQEKLEKKIAAREEAERDVLKKLLSTSEVLLEVVDVRDPMACRSVALEHRILSKGKHLVIVLNKLDAVPKRAVAAWLKYFADAGCLALAYEKTEGGGAAAMLRLLRAMATATEGASPAAAAGGANSGIMFGVFGAKGVSKRVLLDGLLKHSAGRNAGEAVGPLNLVPLKSEPGAAPLVLIDRAGRLESEESRTKGMDPASASAHRTCELLRGATNVTQVGAPKEAVEGLLARTTKESVMRFFEMPDFSNVDEFLITLGKDRGWTSRRNRPLEPDRIAENFLTELANTTQQGDKAQKAKAQHAGDKKTQDYRPDKEPKKQEGSIDQTKVFRYACVPPMKEELLIGEKSLWATAVPGGGGQALLSHPAVRSFLEEQYAAFSGAGAGSENVGSSHLELASIPLNFAAPATVEEDSDEDEEEDMDDSDDEEEDDDDDGDDDDMEDGESEDDGEDDEDDEEEESDEDEEEDASMAQKKTR